ncbi:MAG TPA: 30S ribosomal protein S16 [Anaerolineales bacterium]|nr:30S ribosomal protein S16 [Anaerolineales bacterium]
MVRIRLRRVGSRHQPSYRIVVADRESPRDGRFLEVIGHYNPRTEPATIDLNESRLYHWLQRGAQPSESLAQVLRMSGAWARWERLKGGESMDALLKEAAPTASPIDPRTSRAAAKPARLSKRAKSKAAEAAAAAEAPQAAGEAEPAE